MTDKTPESNRMPHIALSALRDRIAEQERTMGPDTKFGPTLSAAKHAATTVLGLEDHRVYTEAEHFVAETMQQRGFEILNDNADFYVCRLQDVLRLLDTFGLTANALFPKARTDHPVPVRAQEPSSRDGYVALLSDGQFAVVSNGHGFTGTRIHVSHGPLSMASVLPKAEWDKVFKHMGAICPLIAATKHTTVSVQIHATGFPPTQEAPGDE